jgi:hypothetical protein
MKIIIINERVRYSVIIFLIVLLVQLSNSLKGQDVFYAYHTKLVDSSFNWFGKFADLIVVLGKGRQLEFARHNQYLPIWVTPEGSYRINDFSPERDVDTNLEYNYVRLIEQSPEKIMVHWRYFPDISSVKLANLRLEPTNIEGITSVVHELFTIYPDGKVEREVKDARGSYFESWIKPAFAHRQILQLSDSGIEYSQILWGNQMPVLSESSIHNPVIETSYIEEPVLEWNFDEAVNGMTFGIDEKNMWKFAHKTFERKTKEFCPISGHMAFYKEGVSGTSLGFDGYYTGITFKEDSILASEEMSIEAWLALDVYPFNDAPIIHRSLNFGAKGYYLGVGPYGKFFININGKRIESETSLPLYLWTYVAVTVKNLSAKLYVNGKLAASGTFQGEFNKTRKDFVLGLNTEPKRCTDWVRGPDQNIPFIYGIQGLLDEVKVYGKELNESQVMQHFLAFFPKNPVSPLAKAVLPGELGTANRFGATYKNLPFHELWDKTWRLSDCTDIVVKFDNSPVSVIFWHGTNFGPNWVTDNNRWMADQSSELFSIHGCSEHMSDKQCRHCFARIIENNDARVVVHWRYPCVDVGYVCTDRMNYTDEYYTIYPDETAIRKVVFNNTTIKAPGFQDIQYFTNPGETPLDVINLNAVTVANIKGDTYDLVWKKPDKVPQSELEDATIQYMHSRSEWKVFAIYPEPGIGTWGSDEQSKYIDDPFAGPWNHWPVSLVPSDGRFAVTTDRVTHFALGAGDAGDEAIVHYGFTNQGIESLVPEARYWQNPPGISAVSGGQFSGFHIEEKAFHFIYQDQDTMSLRIIASKESPVVNPAFVLKHCSRNPSEVLVNGKKFEPGNSLRIGREYDTHGDPMTIIWLKTQSESPIDIRMNF